MAVIIPFLSLAALLVSQEDRKVKAAAKIGRIK